MYSLVSLFLSKLSDSFTKLAYMHVFFVLFFWKQRVARSLSINSHSYCGPVGHDTM